MIQDRIHQSIVENCQKVGDWFASQSRGLQFPIYSSFDVRDSGWKIAPVDANIFPGGFNNICQVDKEAAPEILRKYFESHYPKLGRRVALLAEEHTQNAFYWENVVAIKSLLEETGLEVLAAWPRALAEPLTLRAVSGKEIRVHEAKNSAGQVLVDGSQVDLIVCNNDFSESYEDWSRGLETPMNPPHELGWYRRRKHDFFRSYNALAQDFAEIIGVQPTVLQVETEIFQDFDASDLEAIEKLASQVDTFLVRLEEKYARLNSPTKPFCFVKNNMGTYGLAVIQAHSGDEIRHWSSKARKKMKAAKGGRTVSELVIQEGIPTRFRDEKGGAAEPCIYLIGSELVGGFLRTHSEKGPDESLNSPGAVYKKLCMADLQIDLPGCPMENVYGWISRLSALALAREAKQAGVLFKGYTAT